MSSSTDIAPIIRYPSSSSSSPLHLRRSSSLPDPTPSLSPSPSPSFLRSLLRSLLPRSSPSPSRRLTLTFFGPRKGRISLAVQQSPNSHPLLLLELATPTSHLIKEMASGMVRILLESDHPSPNLKPKRPLWDEPLWTMFCNGHRCGYAMARQCSHADLNLLSKVSKVSVGAGVMSLPLALPASDEHPALSRSVSNGGGVGVGDGDGEIMYMRAKFERVVGSKDSEALYMMNPDVCGKGEQGTGSAGKNSGNGAPELSIFLLRV